VSSGGLPVKTDTLNHRCLSGEHCVSRTPDGSAITAKPDTLCGGCVKDIQRCFDELPYLRDALKVFLGGSMSVTYTSKVNGSHEPQPPMNVAVYDLIDEIGDVIDRSERLPVATLIRAPELEFVLWRRGKPRKTMLTGVDRALAIRRVHGKAENTVGFNRTWQRRRAPCPICNLLTLGSWIGSDTISCTNTDCNSSFTRDEYTDYCFAEFKTKR